MADYDRELIAEILDSCEHAYYTRASLAEQARLLREADNADAARVHTATQPPAVGVDAPSIEAAHAMGALGGSARDAERLAFEAWMRGHCWALCATWSGTGYVSDAEQGGGYCPHASNTRRLWAAWRDRAALTAALRTGGGDS